jgi:nitroreductase
MVHARVRTDCCTNDLAGFFPFRWIETDFTERIFLFTGIGEVKISLQKTKKGGFMKWDELVKTRRSCRSFEGRGIGEGQLKAILDAGVWAPSPLNLQPWEFIVITSSDVKAKIRGVAEEAKQNVLDGDGPDWVGKYVFNFIEEAPILIVVLFDPTRSGLGSYFGQVQGANQAASACIQNMMLAATEMGLGSLWLTFFDPERLRTVLDIPQTLDIAAIVPIGMPKGEMKAPPRKDAKIHRERYGASD